MQITTVLRHPAKSECRLVLTTIVETKVWLDLATPLSRGNVAKESWLSTIPNIAKENFFIGVKFDFA